MRSKLPAAVSGRKDVEVALLSEYPVRGLVFEAGESLDTMANLVGNACRRLQVQNAASTVCKRERMRIAFKSSHI